LLICTILSHTIYGFHLASSCLTLLVGQEEDHLTLRETCYANFKCSFHQCKCLPGKNASCFYIWLA